MVGLYAMVMSSAPCRGSNKGKELYVENIYEELDAPGEWFYDDESRLLHLMVNGTDAPPRSLWGTRLANLITIQGSMDRPVCSLGGGGGMRGPHPTGGMTALNSRLDTGWVR
jgi:hypothetical protein